ncbi:SDR family NAD(P)-dependent oxidoreductase [Streptomyces sp. WZ-12]|uniref:SDR family NAD(P)-dependent oxidoreductase n=1 Tax=Streptomyces sp. WZ-12 TaxID=3030210 RepID=UPI00238168EF|nr:SDR family NAD(P)-dependent oxidoreductase [Streptomyces sp. WZ-12]
MAGTFVIGAGPGIGQAVARRFAQEGPPIAVLARSRATVDGAVAAVEGAGGKALGLLADAADEASLRAGLDAAVERLGVPDVLVYNAAWVRYDRPGELSAAELTATLRVNVVGAVSAVTHLAPRMAAAGGGTALLTSGMPTARVAGTSLSIGKAGLRAARAVLAGSSGRGACTSPPSPSPARSPRVPRSIPTGSPNSTYGLPGSPPSSGRTTCCSTA